MSARMVIDPAVISESSARVSAAAHGIREQLTRLESEAARAQTAWDGDALEAYRRAQDQWTAGLRALDGIVVEAARAGNASSARYAAAESAVMGIWS